MAEASLVATGTAPSEPPLDLRPVAPELPVGAFLFQFLLVTLVMGGLAYGALRLMRERFPTLGRALQGGGRSLRLVERVALDPQRAAFIVAVGRRHWLLAASGEHITPVAELAPEDLEPAFAAVLDHERQAHAQE